MANLTPEELRHLLRYDPETGRLFWRERKNETRWNSRYANREAFTAAHPKGYKVGAVYRHHYRAHRVIWALQTGQWPAAHIDHIDGNPANNKWNNLRCVTHQQNMQNRKIAAHNKSGVKGVYWDGAKGMWRVQIRADRRKYHFGRFQTLEQAAEIYAKASAELHGQFGRLK